MPIVVGVYPDEETNVPAPVTVAVPTVVPPVVQVAGAVVCGPKTLYVTVPVAGVVELDRIALSELAGIATLVPSVAGAPADSVGLALPTVVFDIVEPQVLFEALL